MNDFDMNEYFLDLAIKEAKKSTSQHGYHIGAIIVKNGKVVSKGHTGREKPYRNPQEHYMHAEEYAISTYQEDLKGATIYVTMEPCNVRRCGAKSCCDLIIESGIKKVVYGVLDPDTYVVCNGIERLSKAKIETFHLKTLEQKCKELTPNLPFNQPI